MFEGISKNVTCLGFYDDGRFMYSGGEDCTARIWDLRQVVGFQSTSFRLTKHKFQAYKVATFCVVSNLPLLFYPGEGRNSVNVCSKSMLPLTACAFIPTKPR